MTTAYLPDTKPATPKSVLLAPKELRRILTSAECGGPKGSVRAESGNWAGSWCTSTSTGAKIVTCVHLPGALSKSEARLVTETLHNDPRVGKVIEDPGLVYMVNVVLVASEVAA